MSAPGPARKRGPGQSEVAGLMVEMGSTKGFDPMPPDQYLYFLGKKEPPLQRLLALVRASTIQRGRRSAYCVDERGKELRLADLEKLLGMEHGNFKRVMREATERGLIRVGRTEPGEGRSAHNSRHPNRIYLCGSVEESKGYEEGEEKRGVCTDPLSFLSPTQRKVYAGWRKEQQERFYAEFDSAVKYKLQVEREAIALARHIGDRALDQVFATHALPKTRLATAPPESKLLQLTLVSAGFHAQNGSVQTRSVPTPANGSALTAKRESVPNGASLLPSEKTEGKKTTPTSVAITEAETEQLSRMMVAASLPVSEETAEALLRSVRSVQPTATPREVLLLAHRLLATAGNVRSPVGLLLSRLHTHAKGAAFEAARGAARKDIQYELSRTYDPEITEQLQRELENAPKAAAAGGGA